ncbi:MAG: hypothetical protein SGBAC_001904 [Bacillariaceae sp.]
MSKLTLTPVKSLSDLSQASNDTNVTDFTSSSDENSSDSRRVSFGAIHVREHERVIGDHPETKIGVPLSLGWGYHDKESVAIEKYEDDRVLKGNLRMSSITRKRILHTVYGIPEEEIRAAETEVRIISERNEKMKKKTEKKTKRSSAMKKVGNQFKKILNADAFIKGLAAASPGTSMMAY